MSEIFPLGLKKTLKCYFVGLVYGIVLAIIWLLCDLGYAWFSGKDLIAASYPSVIVPTATGYLFGYMDGAEQ